MEHNHQSSTSSSSSNNSSRPINALSFSLANSTSTSTSTSASPSPTQSPSPTHSINSAQSHTSNQSIKSIKPLNLTNSFNQSNPSIQSTFNTSNPIRSRSSPSTKRQKFISDHLHLSTSPTRSHTIIKSHSPIESLIILSSLLLSAYRIYQLSTYSNTDSITKDNDHQLQLQLQTTTIPFDLYLILIFIYVLINSFRSTHYHLSHLTYFRVPFTDARGYRDPSQADDGLSIAIGLPLIVSSAVLYSLTRKNQSNLTDAYHHLIHTSNLPNLIQLWNHSHQQEQQEGEILLPSLSTQNLIQSLYSSRINLFSFTIINIFSLLVDLSFSSVANSCAYLPISNSTRFFGSTIKSFIIALVFSLIIRTDSFSHLKLSSLETGVSVFAFLSCFYVISRLARRGFTLGETSIFASTAVALMLEMFRLSISRINYRTFVNSMTSSTILNNQTLPLDLLPGLFRFPTPLVAIQHVFISATFIIGFSLSPLLIWSRRLGQQPTKRLRPTRSQPSTLHPPISSPTTAKSSPSLINSLTRDAYYHQFSNPAGHYNHKEHANQSKDRMRKILSLSIYLGIIYFGWLILRAWLGWLLNLSQSTSLSSTTSFTEKFWGNGLNWVFGFCFGDWKRLIIMGYWITCLIIGIGGWTTYLIKKKRNQRKESDGHRHLLHHHYVKDRVLKRFRIKELSSTWMCSTFLRLIKKLFNSSWPSTSITNPSKHSKPVGVQHDPDQYPLIVNQTNNNSNNSCPEKKVVGNGLNLRRKFFHGLSCLMFIPAILIDPGFTSLAFTVAFVGFTFLEFLRYFAVYPIGVSIHLFFNEFIDSKDSGPVILSHFYLLTACSTGLWLEGNRLGSLIGVFVVGWSDAWASIIGRKWGKGRDWYCNRSKTVEGTLGFIGSLVFIGLGFRYFKLVEQFSIFKFILGSILIGSLEAFTNQNDNLVVPLFAWSIFELLDL